MRRLLLALWLVFALVMMFVVGLLLHAPVGHFGSPSSLIIAALWLVGVVPVSFFFYFRAQHRREEEVVARAVALWKAGDPSAGQLVAEGIELALAEEDEAALKRLMDALSSSAPGRLPDATLQTFVAAATEWLKDDGGHHSRDEHLERAREAARPVMTQLAALR